MHTLFLFSLKFPSFNIVYIQVGTRSPKIKLYLQQAAYMQSSETVRGR